MSKEHATYLSVKHSYKIAESMDFKVVWYIDSWEVTSANIRAVGETVAELHHYLNGYRDGISKKAEEDQAKALQ
jgi:hypothetical protein